MSRSRPPRRQGSPRRSLPTPRARVDGVGPDRRISTAAANCLVDTFVAVSTNRSQSTPVHPPLSCLPVPTDCLASGPALAVRSVRRSRTSWPARDHVRADTPARMTEPACPFCSPPLDRLFHQGRLVLGLWDQFPVSPGHALIIPRRHVASWFDATEEERVELMAAAADARV